MNLSTLRIIWIALLGSQFMYDYALKMMIKMAGSGPIETNRLLFGIFALSGGLILLIGVYLSNFMLEAEKKKLHSLYSPTALKQLDFEDFVKSFVSPYILRLALFESVALLGLAIAIIHKNPILFYPFAAASSLAFLINFPTEEKVKEALL